MASAASSSLAAAFTELVERWHRASAEVRIWWLRHAPLGSGIKRLLHPRLGDLELKFVTLQVADDPEQKVVTFAATAQQQLAFADLTTEP